MLAALGSFAFKYFSLEPTDKNIAAVELAIVQLLGKIDINMLQIQPLRDDCDCYNVYHEHNFNLCFFVMKKDVFMPLHDHPNMTVFSKILFGAFLLSSYEFVLDAEGKPVQAFSRGLRSFKTRRTTQTIRAGSKNDILTIKPNTGHGLHSFKCVSDTAIFMDVLGPPYNETDRNCTYYEEIPSNPHDHCRDEIELDELDPIEIWITVSPKVSFHANLREYIS